MKRVFVKRILRLSSVSRLMQPGDESLLMHSTNGAGQLFYASQFNPLNDNPFSVQTTRATSITAEWLERYNDASCYPTSLCH